jgi:hypothetical protein
MTATENAATCCRTPSCSFTTAAILNVSVSIGFHARSSRALTAAQKWKGAQKYRLLRRLPIGSQPPALKVDRRARARRTTQISVRARNGMPCRRAARFGVSPIIPRSCATPEPIRSPIFADHHPLFPRARCPGCSRRWIDRPSGRRPGMPQVGQDRPVGRIRLAAKPRHLVRPTATARDQPGSRGGSNKGCRRAPQGGLQASPKNGLRIRPTDVRLVGEPICAETHQRLSEALCRAFGGQASVCAHRRPDPHSTWGSGHCLLQLLHVALEQSGEPPAGGAAHEVLGT